MRFHSFLVLLSTAAVVAGPGTARGDSTTTGSRAATETGPIVDRPIVSAPDGQHTVEAGLPGVSKLIYVNGCWDGLGCAIRRGTVNDALDEVSIIPNVDMNQTVIVSAFEHGEEVWNQTIQCLREVYSPYEVTILDSRVDRDPGLDLLPHHEAILAGHPSELNLSNNIGGIAAASCEPINNAISFSFSNIFGPDVVDLCWTVAQESAHSFGLDHALECLDPMTYIPGCGQKFFRNALSPCGESTERTCRCGGKTQNSHTRLLTVFGKGTDPAPPDLSITSPTDGDIIAQDTAIQFVASDPRLVQELELHVNGWLYDTLPGHSFGDQDDPYEFTLPTLPDSVLDIEIRAYNDLESMSSQTLRVTKGGPCSSAATCLDGQECDGEGRCIYPEPTGVLGDVCVRSMDCVSHLCGASDGDQLCTESCVIGSVTSCPEGFECAADGTNGFCWPVQTAGCCSVGADRTPDPSHVLLFVLCAAIMLRRARPRRAQ